MDFSTISTTLAWQVHLPWFEELTNNQQIQWATCWSDNHHQIVSLVMVESLSKRPSKPPFAKTGVCIIHFLCQKIQLIVIQ